MYSNHNILKPLSNTDSRNATTMAKKEAKLASTQNGMDMDCAECHQQFNNPNFLVPRISRCVISLHRYLSNIKKINSPKFCDIANHRHLFPTKLYFPGKTNANQPPRTSKNIENHTHVCHYSICTLWQ